MKCEKIGEVRGMDEIELRIRVRKVGNYKKVKE
jgi:hypothetical protein